MKKTRRFSIFELVKAKAPFLSCPKARKHIPLPLRSFRGIKDRRKSFRLYKTAPNCPTACKGQNRRVGNDGGDLLLRNAVRFGVLQRIFQRRIGDPLRHERDYRHDTARFPILSFSESGSLPKIAIPSVMTESGQSARISARLCPRPLPSWVQKGRTVLPAREHFSRKVQTAIGTPPQ